MNSTKMQITFLAYLAFLLAGLIILFFVCSDAPPAAAPQGKSNSSETAMLEACADMLARAMDKQPYIDHHVSDGDEYLGITTKSEPAYTRKSKLLPFPADAMLGEVQVGEFGPNKRVMPSGWVKYAEAAGKVAVDPAKAVRLLVHPGALNLSAARALKGDDLQHLDLSRTPIENDQLKDITNLTGLLVLNLHKCHIDDGALPYLKGFKQLLFLDFGGTQVSDKATLLASTLPNLEFLVFSKCPNVTGRHLSKLLSVSCLLMDDTALNSEGIREAAAMKELREFYAAGTHITDGDLKLLTNTKIVALALGRTMVSGKGLKYLNPALRRIDLDDCHIGDDSMNELGHRPSLLNLNLAGTQVTDAGLKAILSDTNLEQLDLTRTGVSNAAITELSSLSKLTRLILPSQISELAISNLKHKLPKCQVIQHYD